MVSRVRSDSTVGVDADIVLDIHHAAARGVIPRRVNRNALVAGSLDVIVGDQSAGFDGHSLSVVAGTIVAAIRTGLRGPIRVADDAKVFVTIFDVRTVSLSTPRVARFNRIPLNQMVGAGRAVRPASHSVRGV